MLLKVGKRTGVDELLDKGRDGVAEVILKTADPSSVEESWLRLEIDDDRCLLERDEPVLLVSGEDMVDDGKTAPLVAVFVSERVDVEDRLCEGVVLSG